jgi:hypothetical protein
MDISVNSCILELIIAVIILPIFTIGFISIPAVVTAGLFIPIIISNLAITVYQIVKGLHRGTLKVTAMALTGQMCLNFEQSLSQLLRF